MSKGRFELQRALRAADGRQSGGLDIVVLDSHTGTTRPVSSLSGGEGFMASLSLALGLADVVQNHAGGVRLESLFIDEGFGSLDAEALDQALQVLTDLRQSGRSIGIISHVTELKERISARIEVVPQARGSVARIVGGIPTVPTN
jgi:exonuclease SbcC